MRLWSIHPRYLDAKGLVALWREGLLAKKVLEGKTVGYRNHPQLQRFREMPDPVSAIHAYLWEVLLEAQARGYAFDESKIVRQARIKTMPVTDGQIAYERAHLLRKLSVRDPAKKRGVSSEKTFEPLSLFRVIRSPVVSWERV